MASGPTHSFLVDEAGARAAAQVVDDERRRGINRGPLHGMPISIKDLIDIAGQPTTAASKVRAGHVAQRDAIAVKRLREAGAVIIGKTNLHEFALGTTSEESAFGAVHNPRDLSRSAGGSSGGSAAAVATGMSVASVGSDTGGSIRIPAAACGVVGLKPTFAEVPTDGVVPLCATFDHVGPIASSVTDAAALWAVLAGRVPRSIESPKPAAVTLGLLGDYFTALLESEVRSAFERAIDRLRASGIELVRRSVAETDAIVDTYVNILSPRGRPLARADARQSCRRLSATGARASRARPDDLRRELSSSARGATISHARRRFGARGLRRTCLTNAADRRATPRRRSSDDGCWAERDAARSRGDASTDAALQHDRDIRRFRSRFQRAACLWACSSSADESERLTCSPWH
jgi:Asp-tRNA(Asn)/Glu-tRNA(Gln) amidotransferase A subunit family amidase